MEQGYVKLFRQLTDSWVFADEKVLKVWIWLLFKANYKDNFMKVHSGRGSDTIEVKRGQLIFGRISAEEQLGFSGSAIYRILKKLEEQEMIVIKSTAQFSTITICNYDTYQSENLESEHRSNNEGTALEQATDTSKNDNKEKKVKNNTSRSAKSDVSEDVLSLYDSYPLKKGRGAALVAIEKAIAQLKSQPKLIADFLADKNLSAEQLEKYSKPINFLKRRVEHFAALQVDKDKQFIKHPATWFNQECYLDEMELKPTQVYYEKRNY